MKTVGGYKEESSSENAVPDVVGTWLLTGKQYGKVADNVGKSQKSSINKHEIHPHCL